MIMMMTGKNDNNNKKDESFVCQTQSFSTCVCVLCFHKLKANIYVWFNWFLFEKIKKNFHKLSIETRFYTHRKKNNILITTNILWERKKMTIKMTFHRKIITTMMIGFFLKKKSRVYTHIWWLDFFFRGHHYGHLLWFNFAIFKKFVKFIPKKKFCFHHSSGGFFFFLLSSAFLSVSLSFEMLCLVKIIIIIIIPIIGFRLKLKWN